MAIEESAPKKDAGEPEALNLGEKLQVIPPLETSERVPAFVQTLDDSSPYYERLRRKRAFASATAPLTCEGHPFFADTPALPEVMKSFYDDLLATEGNIFQECSVAWPAFRSIIMNGLFDSVRKLEKYMISDVPTVVLEEVAEVTALAAQNGVRVE